MRMPGWFIGGVLLVSLALALTAALATELRDLLRPDPVKFVSLTVADPVAPGDVLVVSAETERQDTTGCTGGVQSEIRTANETVIRLPNPEREMSMDGKASVYRIEVPDDLGAGSYSIRLRETFNCGGDPLPVETPWVRFRVSV